MYILRLMKDKAKVLRLVFLLLNPFGSSIFFDCGQYVLDMAKNFDPEEKCNFSL